MTNITLDWNQFVIVKCADRKWWNVSNLVFAMYLGNPADNHNIFTEIIVRDTPKCEHKIWGGGGDGDKGGGGSGGGGNGGGDGGGNEVGMMMRMVA